MHGKPGLIHGAPSDSKTKPWLSHMPILQVSCCRTLGPLLPVASHSSAIACCVALEQRLGRAKFFAACMVGQIRCFGVNATSPRAREPGSTCGDLIQAYLLVSSMAQAATLSMYPSSWISKIGRHVNTSRIESFEFSQPRQRNTTKMTFATHRHSTHRPACYMLTLLLPGHTQHMRCVRTMALLLVGVLLP